MKCCGLNQELQTEHKALITLIVQVRFKAKVKYGAIASKGKTFFETHKPHTFFTLMCRNTLIF